MLLVICLYFCLLNLVTTPKQSDHASVSSAGSRAPESSPITGELWLCTGVSLAKGTIQTCPDSDPSSASYYLKGPEPGTKLSELFLIFIMGMKQPTSQSDY